MWMTQMIVTLNFVLICHGCGKGYWHLVPTLYLNVFLHAKPYNELQYWMGREIRAFATFRDPTEEQLNQGRQCAVCLQNMYVSDAKVIACDHIFHRYCIWKCFREKPLCPLCRAEDTAFKQALNSQ